MRLACASPLSTAMLNLRLKVRTFAKFVAPACFANLLADADNHVVLNPADGYVIRGGEEIVCVAQGIHEMEVIQSMVRFHLPSYFASKESVQLRNALRK